MKKYTFDAIVITSVLISLGLYISESGPLDLIIETDPLRYIAKLFALVGLILLCYSFILSSRIRVVEHIVGGLDKVYQKHHIIGGLAFTLLLQHPIFLILSVLPNTVLAEKYIIPFSGIDEYTYGILALYSMILLISLTIFVKLPYHIWKFTHVFFGVPLLLACLHIIFVDGIIANNFFLKMWVFGFIALAFSCYVYKRFLYEYLGPKYTYAIKDIKVHNNDVSEIWLEPIDENRQVRHRPGEFMFVRFLDPKIWRTKHPFGFASFRDGGFRMAIKDLGDFTAKVKELNTGSKADIWGPYGHFPNEYLDDDNHRDNIWIAGGIGIVPFLSMLEHYVKEKPNKKIWFYYATVKTNEAYFDPEIQGKIAGLPVVYETFPEESKGFLTAEKIKQDAGELVDKEIFVCGPPGMMNALEKQFKAAGVPQKQIHMEEFALN